MKATVIEILDVLDAIQCIKNSQLLSQDQRSIMLTELLSEMPLEMFEGQCLPQGTELVESEDHPVTNNDEDSNNAAEAGTEINEEVAVEAEAKIKENHRCTPEVIRLEEMRGHFKTAHTLITLIL